jgi:excisionase family DNA binding protein
MTRVLPFPFVAFAVRRKRPAPSPDRAASLGVPALLTVDEAVELLRLGRSTVYELIETGELRSYVIGGRRLIPLEALRDLIDRSAYSPAYRRQI